MILVRIVTLKIELLKQTLAGNKNQLIWIKKSNEI